MNKLTIDDVWLMEQKLDKTQFHTDEIAASEVLPYIRKFLATMRENERLRAIPFAENQEKIEKILAENGSAYPEAARHDIACKIMQALYGIWIEPNRTETRLYHNTSKHTLPVKEVSPGVYRADATVEIKSGTTWKMDGQNSTKT